MAVILAGGTGTRFWPASTTRKPKQFLRLVGDRSLLQLAYDRIKAIVPSERTLVLTAMELTATVKRHVPQLKAKNIIGEPMRRDTAAAIALATLLVHERFGPSTVAVLTADHLIDPAHTFRAALLSVAKSAAAGKNIYTFGIPPTSPATGYGYLEVGEIHTDHQAVRSFHEKPDKVTASAYVASKRFLWNSGMLVFHTDLMRQTMSRLLPQQMAALMPVAKKLSPSALKKAFASLPTISIDKAVMEKLATTMCVRANFAWSDVGGFPALAAHLSRDDGKNALRGRVRTKDARGNVVWCEDANEVVALVGVSNLVVVRAGKRTLVVPLDRADEIKELVELLPRGER